MEDKSLSDLVSQILPDEVEQTIGLDKAKPAGDNNILIASLKAAAGQSGSQVENAIDQFLKGEGDLLETTRSAVSRSKTTAKNEVAAFLEEKFKLSPAVAKLIAMLLVKIFPAISELTGETAAKKKKPRRKKDPKPTASSKKKPSKKKAKPRPKTTASKPAAKKKKTSTSSSKKKATTRKKPKKKTRTTTSVDSAA
ncbi:MAG TPA: hypothetical protein VN363_07905 [Anaerolineales bacterium]|nr:hypothetical protein [Anaerolineales bacterium]